MHRNIRLTRKLIIKEYVYSHILLTVYIIVSYRIVSYRIVSYCMVLHCYNLNDQTTKYSLLGTLDPYLCTRCTWKLWPTYYIAVI